MGGAAVGVLCVLDIPSLHGAGRAVGGFRVAAGVTGCLSRHSWLNPLNFSSL